MPPAMSAGAPNRLESVQILRAFCCCMIVLFHAEIRAVRTWPELFPGSTSPWLYSVGHSALDVFFVVSGFMMTYLYFDRFGQEGIGGTFFRRRVIRVVPLYWLLTTIALIAWLIAPGLFTWHRMIEPLWLVGMYVFIPFPKADGMFQPIVGAGWALSYDMLFYALFALVLCLRRGWLLAMAAMAAAVGLGFVLQPEHPALRILTGPYLIDFIWGVGLAALLRRFDVPRFLAWPFIAAGLAIAALLIPYEMPLWLRVIIGGGAGSFLVAGAVLLRLRFPGLGGRAIVLLGDATFSLFLSHVLALPAIALILNMVGAQQVLPPLALILVMLAGSCAGAVLLYLLFERPVQAALDRRFGRRNLIHATIAPSPDRPGPADTMPAGRPGSELA